LQEASPNALVFAVAARIAHHRAEAEKVPELLAEAQRRLPRLSYAMPIVTVQTHLELARTYLGLADHAGARNALNEAASILRRRPDLGPLAADASELETMLSSPGSYVVGASALTPAELRVVPLLATHLGFKEIAERLFVSHHTVKSHALAVYRKLDATSRSEAVERAQEIGLL
jgi:LuxR family maltose regulon positive regulatory protein